MTRDGCRRARGRSASPPALRPSSLAPLLLVFVLAGCLPFSCRRTESRALMPSDSLSRDLARAMRADTLEAVWTSAGPADRPLAYPRTLAFGPGGRLYAGDTERHAVYAFTESGAFAGAIAWEGLAYPYLAGARGDTLLVFSPTAHRLFFVTSGRPHRSVPTPADLPEDALQYAAATSRALYFKAVADGAAYLARLDERGGVTTRVPLAGPAWRRAGLLRSWGDSLLSLSGYRPVVDVVSPAGGLDTLLLTGFDSPMLSRSRLFLLGETDEPPLLSSAAAPAGDLLFVLNLRSGWLQVDAYDRTGRLRHLLLQPEPTYNRQFYPMDLAVRRRADGSYDVAVAIATPRPEVQLYRWKGDRVLDPAGNPSAPERGAQE